MDDVSAPPRLPSPPPLLLSFPSPPQNIVLSPVSPYSRRHLLSLPSSFFSSPIETATTGELCHAFLSTGGEAPTSATSSMPMIQDRRDRSCPGRLPPLRPPARSFKVSDGRPLLPAAMVDLERERLLYQPCGEHPVPFPLFPSSNSCRRGHHHLLLFVPPWPSMSVSSSCRCSCTLRAPYAQAHQHLPPHAHAQP